MRQRTATIFSCKKKIHFFIQRLSSLYSVYGKFIGFWQVHLIPADHHKLSKIQMGKNQREKNMATCDAQMFKKNCFHTVLPVHWRWCRCVTHDDDDDAACATRILISIRRNVNFREYGIIFYFYFFFVRFRIYFFLVSRHRMVFHTRFTRNIK